MEITNELVPYVVKRFKILSIDNKEKQCDVAYVNSLNETELKQLEDFIDKRVIFKKKIDETEFWQIASDIYPDISFEGVNPKEPVKVVEEKSQVQKTENKITEIDLSKVPMNALVMEIRNRQIALDAEAVIEIKPNMTASFEFSNLPWPTGKYRTKLQIVEELPLNPATPTEEKAK